MNTKFLTSNHRAGLAIALLGSSALITASAAIIKVNPGESIQAAVNVAAPGDTIQLAAGVYQEQVLIADKDLNLVGEPGAILKAPVAMTTTLAPVTTRRAVLGIVRSVVNVKGLAFDGNRSGAVNPRLTGVYHLSANGTVTNCSFQGFRSVPRDLLVLGNRETAYIAANLVAAAGPDITHAEVLNSTFADNEAGIIFLGDDTAANPDPEQLRQTFVAEGNQIIGIGVGTNSFQTGVRINLGASGEVGHNTIRDHLSTGNVAGLGVLGSAGIFVRDNPGLRPNNPRTTQPVLVEGNTLVNNLCGINLLASDGSRAVNNHIDGGGTDTGFSNEGGIGLSGNDVGAINNHIANSSVGINLFANPAMGVASNAKVIANRISGAAMPIDAQVGVTDTKQQANRISP
jgi:parallel beta-helix repeat protein